MQSDSQEQGRLHSCARKHERTHAHTHTQKKDTLRHTGDSMMILDCLLFLSRSTTAGAVCHLMSLPRQREPESHCTQDDRERVRGGLP